MCSVASSQKRLGLWVDPGPDSGWSWVILVCNCLFIFLSYGFCITGSAGILFVEFVSVFGIGRKDAAWPFSFIGIMQCMAGLSAGVVNVWFDLRTVNLVAATCCSLALVLCFWATNLTYISLVFSFLYGYGNGLYMTTSMLYFKQYFKRYLGLVNGIFMVTVPIAGMVLPYLVNYLVETYGLRGAFLLMGGVLMQLIIAASLLKPRTARHFATLRQVSFPLLVHKSPELAIQESSKKSCDVFRSYQKVLSDLMFYVVTVQAVVTQSLLSGVSLTLTDFARDNQLTKEIGINLLMVFSGADMVARVAIGVASDRGWCNQARVSLVCLVAAGLSVILLGVVRDVWWFAGCSLVAGVCEGILATNASIHYMHYLDKQQLPVAFGLRLVSNGTLAFLRPLIAGYFRDSYASYIPFYYFLGCSLLFSAFLWSLEPCIMRIRTSVNIDTEAGS